MQNMDGTLMFHSYWWFLGTVVMKVVATDDDQENTSHSAIAYRIAEQSNQGGMFYISPQTGEIIVQRSTLDREVSC